MDYAKSKGGVPLYIFYNWLYDTEWNITVTPQGWNEIELYGCSFVTASFIHSEFYLNRVDKKHGIRWTTPSFRDIHPEHGQPLHHLFCRLMRADLDDWPVLLNLPADTHIQLHHRDTIIPPEDWTDLSPPPAINGIPEYDLVDPPVSRAKTPVFKPKYRVLFLMEQRQTRLYQFS